MSALNAFLIAVIQGATEMFPVSSLGHAVILPAVFGLGVDQSDPSFLPFIVLLHAGTAVALLFFFWRDWAAILRGTLGLADPHTIAQARRLLLLLVIGTIPAVVVGFAVKALVAKLFATPMVAAVFLLVNAAILLVAERLRGTGERPLSSLTIFEALFIGGFQCLALLPGISRSGATIAAGLFRGLGHENAGKFSFLLATPVIIGATVLEVPKLLKADVAPGVFAIAFQAAVVSGLTAFAATWVLMRVFRDNDTWSLAPFAAYCVALGSAALVLLNV